ncbi:hypothetical protein BRARA_C01552 [Brassica rapa]|uniref:Epidermal patterning factor-like protein n=1 Tax=Brassica campestris TaxID=3711 RepID=A0A397ZWW5_BRACM|nr:hypothetical protein BRARA_C01552 [Brassica rapa]
MGSQTPSSSSSIPSSEKSRAKFSLFYIFLLCVVLYVLATSIPPSSLSSPYIRNSNSGKLGHFYAQVRKLFYPLLSCTEMPCTPEKNLSRSIRFSTRGQEEEGKSTLVIKKMRIGDWTKEAELRRILKGLGSSPPRCTSKCGRCTPCKPVHVPVSSGTPVTAEYYPETWRCKCGNKLYMP